MAHNINHSDEPIRLFKSNFLEFFTHISPVVVVLIWLPVSGYFLTRGIQSIQDGHAWWFVPVAFLLGLFLWTFTEYTMHRFVFHFKPRTKWQERLAFLFHGVHHHQPQMKTRLVMPPVVSIPLALIVYTIIWLIFDVLFGLSWWVAPAFSGLLLGYLLYDLTHYATHHFPMRSGYLKFLKRYHMQHHYKTPDQRYGVTVVWWDRVFKTYPVD